MINLKENYGNIESYVSENGMGVQDEERFLKDGIIQDDYRIQFIREHLKWLHRAIEEGCNVKGYHLWTFMDNWSWMNAYKNRYGLISVDLQNPKKGPRRRAPIGFGKWPTVTVSINPLQGSGSIRGIGARWGEMLTRRMQRILRELMGARAPVTGKYLADVNRVTVRTIRKDIKHLDELLSPQHGARVESLMGKGYQLVIRDGTASFNSCNPGLGKADPGSP